MKRIKIFLLIIVFSNISVFSQKSQPSAVVVEIDSVNENRKDLFPADSLLRSNPVSKNRIYPKKFEDFSSKYKDEDFNYETIKPRESFWNRLERKILKLIKAIFGDIDGEQTSKNVQLIIRLFAIVIIGFILYFLLKYIFGKEGSFFFGKKNKKINLTEEELSENIHEINFPESIFQYEKQEDFRSAIRYNFLYLLKKLSDKKLIEWNPEKTNKDYYNELNSVMQKDEFHKLSYIFNYVWYGEFEVDSRSYEIFKNQFQSFKI